VRQQVAALQTAKRCSFPAARLDIGSRRAVTDVYALSSVFFWHDFAHTLGGTFGGLQCSIGAFQSMTACRRQGGRNPDVRHEAA
jgi:hypothetical protein